MNSLCHHTLSLDPGTAALRNLGGNAHLNEKKLQKCQGDCDRDTHCADGLYCFLRNNNEKVPGCSTGGDGDVRDVDFCVGIYGELRD